MSDYILRSEMCKSCAHTKVCMKDKNLCGDVFVMGHPCFFDNDELYRRYKEWEAAGFPCEDYLQEQKHGEWKTVSVECFGGGTMTEYECSLCKERQIIMSNFCPNCGTDMRAEDGE